MRKLLFLTAIAASIISCAPGRYSVEESNDYFTLFNTDRDYTQGLAVSHENEDRKLKFAQEIYTPQHKKNIDPIDGERPYSGYLYAGIEKKKPIDNENRYIYGVDVGIVGPAALGQQIQCGFHKAVGQACPSGWHNQLDNEPVVTLKGAIEVERPTELFFTETNLITHIQGKVGNLIDEINIGSRIHYEPIKYLRLIAGPDFHFVAYNVLIEGNSSGSRGLADLNWFYSEMNAGFEFLYNEYSLKWVIVVSSPQYEGQGSSYNYGMVTFSWTH